MKLLSEINANDVETLVEQTSTGKKYYVEGRWATAEEPNKNGRMYPMDVMESALGKYSKDYISEKRALGELGHPAGPSVNLDRVSHNIEGLRMEGNHVVGRAKILQSTPMGAIAANLIDEGIKLGVSTRGLGSLAEGKDGIKRVQNDFFISAIDLVSDPSGPGCWVSGIQEGIEYQMLEDGRIMELIVDSKKGKINEQKAISAFYHLMKNLRG